MISKTPQVTATIWRPCWSYEAVTVNFTIQSSVVFYSIHRDHEYFICSTWDVVTSLMWA